MNFWRSLTITAVVLGLSLAILWAGLASSRVEQRGSPDQDRPDAFLALLNAGDAPVAVTLAFEPVEGRCAAGLPEPQTRSLRAGELAIFDNDPAGRSGVPADCLASARIDSTDGQLAALVIDRWEDSDAWIAQTAQSQKAGANRVALPHWSWPEKGAGASRIAVQNLGEEAVNARLRLWDAQGKEFENCAEACALRLEPGAAGLWAVEDIPGVSPGASGAALVESEGLILASVSRDHGADPEPSLGASLYSGQALTGEAGRSERLPFPDLPNLAGPPATGEWGRLLGQAQSELHGMSTEERGAIDARLNLVLEGGQGSASLDLGKLEPFTPFSVSLAGRREVAQGRHAGMLESSGSVAALAEIRYPSIGLTSSYGPPAVGSDLLMPLVLRGVKGRGGWIQLQNAGESLSSYTLDLYASGSTKPIASASGRLQPGAAESLDLDSDPRLEAAGSDFVGWARLSGTGPLAALVWLVENEGAPSMTVYAGLPPEALGPVLHAPMVFSTRPDAPAQSSATPPPTPTLLPGRDPTATPPRLPGLDPNDSWERLVDAREFDAAGGSGRVARAPDGTIWCRLRGDQRSDSLVALRAGQSAQRYASLEEAVARAYAEILAGGSLPGFWAVDPAGRVWIGPRFFDGQTWRSLAESIVQPGGEIRLGDEAVLDDSGRAWISSRSETECERPEGCSRQSLRALDPAGRAAPAIDLESDPLSEAYGVAAVQLLGGGGRRATALADSSTEATDSVASEADAPAGLGQALGGTWAVSPRMLYRIPSGQAIEYPPLEAPPSGQPTALRNAGYASAAALDAAGRLLVLTWVELQSRAGDAVESAYFLDRWDDAIGGWGVSQQVAGPGSPSPFDPARERITAMGACADGSLWLGSSSGKLALWTGSAWGERHLPGQSPLPPAPITDLACQADGRVLISTHDGLLRYRPDPGSVTPTRILLPRLDLKR